MAQFPFVGFCAELFVAHGDLRVAFPEFFDDGKELFRGWLSIVDGYTEAGNQGKLLPVSYTHLDVYKRQVLDLHTHTIASGHAYNTMMEMIHEAQNKGLDVYCLLYTSV